MINVFIIMAGALALSGAVWYVIFYHREKRLLNRLQEMINQAMSGNIERTEISEEKYSALENSLKRYLDDSLLSGENHKKQNEVIQSLISDIAHQTLTPVSNLKIYGEMLSEESQENRELIDTILEQTEKLDFLIQSLVKLSRMESGIIAVHPEQNSISRLLDEIRRQYSVKAKERDITLSLCETDLSACFDMKWTAEAIGNMVDNAIKYTEKAGNVAISVEKYSFFVRIDITDNGIGMEAEEIPKIFGRFYRSISVMERPGVGIGLYLAREIVQAQRGYIKVISEKEKGSTFSVFLPV